MNFISKKQILHLAHLANLKISKDEIKSFKKHLAEVLNYFEKLKDLETYNIEPTSQTTGLMNVYRKDSVVSERVLKSEEAIYSAEKVYNGAFVANQVINKDL